MWQKIVSQGKPADPHLSTELSEKDGDAPARKYLMNEEVVEVVSKSLGKSQLDLSESLLLISDRRHSVQGCSKNKLTDRLTGV